MIEKAIFNILQNDGSTSDLPLYFGINPYKVLTSNTGTPPTFAVFYRNSTIPNDTKTGNAIGTITSKTGMSTLDEAQIQVNLFSPSADEVALKSNKVRSVLDRISGTFASVKVQSIQFTNMTSGFEFEESYEGHRIYQITQFYKCRFQPSPS